MTKISKLTVMMLICASIHLCSAEDFPPSRDAVECTPRTGLPNFFSKLEGGGEIKVAYLGGSITEQQGWRVKSLAYLQKLYPKAKFKEINAALGGTGSDLGAFRIERDVLKYAPDILFVEFAVNDAEVDPKNIVKSMEGIVRKTWKSAPDCDICFAYTLTGESKIFDDLKAGRLNRSAAAMEVVADKYQIPSIHMGLEVVRLEKEGLLVMKAPGDNLTVVSGDTLNQASKVAVGPDGKIPFSKDGVHPYTDTGHQLYEEAFERSMAQIKAASKDVGPHHADTALDSGNYENAIMLPLDAVALAGPWSKLSPNDAMGKLFMRRIDSLWKGSPGATLSFKFKGSCAYVYQLLGPGCGKLEITVDGISHNAMAIDAHCVYYRLSLLRISGDLDPAKAHEITIKVLPDKLDKANILFEKLRSDITQNPSKYEPLDWYAGALFVLGDLVKPEGNASE